jgi:hypothetical protein
VIIMVKDKWRKISETRYEWNKRYLIIHKIKGRFKTFVEYSDKQRRFVGWFKSIADLELNWNSIE